MAFLNDESKSFDELTPEQRSLIIESWVNYDNIQIHSEGLLNSWRRHIGEIRKSGIYRVPEMKTKVFWENIPDKYVAYCRDADGMEFLHTGTPEAWYESYWGFATCDTECMCIHPDLIHLIRELGDEAPKDSLILRDSIS